MERHLRTYNKQVLFFFLSIIFLKGCKSDYVDLNTIYDKTNFKNDYLELLERKDIDSALYFRGLILRKYAEKKQKWNENMEYREIVDWVEDQVQIKGYYNEQNFEDDLFEFKMNKDYIDSTRIDFCLNTRLKDIKRINDSDTIKILITHQNLAGESTSGVLVFKEITEKELNSKVLNFEYTLELDDYKSDFPTWKYNNLNQVPNIIYGKFSTFKMIRYFLVRDNSVINEVEIKMDK